ncbi:hypothetical protein Q757_06590 [Oenococcus alcoholitolerans]|uniref:Uncharacterized protein n=1 Tax=Oenococcus alcoholitolerans TaxID=931074 RepID=A0ABR4XQJ3_9LACO|nr:hypothetical protein Q757_06590 [Oenococcus alcoholitolerans]
MMDIGPVMDFITEYVNQETKSQKSDQTSGKDKQAKIDALFG